VRRRDPVRREARGVEIHADGGPGVDVLDGGAGRNVFNGGTGNDELNGHGGGDVLSGDDGDDRLARGGGNDDSTEAWAQNRPDSPTGQRRRRGCHDDAIIG
jgi:Ca2+-binding RTX toxin-like protein